MKSGWKGWWVRLACVAVVAASAPALGWNAAGHRAITRPALDGLKGEVPSWLREPGVVARIAEESNEPDRWRGTRLPAINHFANQEHYIDVEDLGQYGLTLQTVPRMRYDFVKAMVTARVEHPERMLPVDAAHDPDHTKEWTGFLPQAIDEHYAKLRSSFNTLRILEAVNDPSRAAGMEQARENVIYEMGMLSHFVGDAAQPLHTTRHHHGWVGENPNGYTVSNGFHAYIDGEVLRIHGLDYESLKGSVKFERVVTGADEWPQTLAHVQRSFEQVEPLYKLRKSGELEKEAGKAFITERLADGASMLAAMYNAAWEESKPTDGEVASYLRFSETKK